MKRAGDLLDIVSGAGSSRGKSERGSWIVPSSLPPFGGGGRGGDS